MDPNGPLGVWAVLTDDERVITEQDCLWPDLPPDVRVRELRYRDRLGRLGKIEGFESYGFQRSSLTPVGGGPGIIHATTQLMGLRGGTVTLVEINEITGESTNTSFPASELTYMRSLLRTGA